MTDDEKRRAEEETGILLLTPSSTPKGGRQFDLLTKPNPEAQNVLAITYDGSPERFIGGWRTHVGERPTNLGIVDVGETMRSVASPSGDADGTGTAGRNVIRAVDHPSNLDELDRVVNAFLDEWTAHENRTVVHFDSVGSLLRHVDLRTASEFLDGLVDRLRAVGGVGYFCLEADACRDRTVNVLAPLFDAVIELGPDGNRTSAGARAAIETERTQTPELSTDEVFDLLRVERRRSALRYLVRRAGPVAMGELAERIASWEGEKAVDAVTADECKRVRTALFQFHVPKLADAGLIRYDETRGIVTLTDASRIEPYLKLAAERDPGGP